MNSEVTIHVDGDRQAARARFVNEGARAELAEHVAVFCRPAEHEGSEVTCVKRGASRTVWRCRLGGAAYYLKHYHTPGLLRRFRRWLFGSDAEREMRYSQRLASHGIATTEVLAVGRAGRRTWLVSRAAEAASPMSAWHDERAESHDPRVAAEVRAVTLATAELVGKMHAAGIIHQDLHTGNILIQGDASDRRLVLMDLHRMSRRRWLSRRARAKNLAALMHDRQHATTRTLRLAFLKRYLAVARTSGTLQGWQVMVTHFAAAHTRSIYAARDRRVTGNNKYFTRLRLRRGWRGHAVLASKRRLGPSAAAGMSFTRAQWQQLLAEPEKLFDAPDAAVVKDSPSSLVLRRSLIVGGHSIDVYIKRNRRKRAYKFLTDAFRASRAKKSFRLGHALLTRRLATALPLVALERRIGPFLQDSILIAEAVAPAERLNRFLERWLGRRAAKTQGIDTAKQQQLARDLLHQLGRMLRQLHANGFAHRDLKANNVLVHWTQEGPPQMVLVDLDGLSRPWWLTARRGFHSLMRLNVSLLECTCVNHAGRLRMLLGYLRRPGDGRIAFKPYWRELQRWSDKKLRRQIVNRRRKQKHTRR